MKEQTSIMAVQFDGGVVIGADSRTTTGSYIVRLTFRRLSLQTNLANRLTALPTNSPTSTTASTAADRAQPPTPRPSPTSSTSTLKSTPPFTVLLRLSQLLQRCSRSCVTRIKINCQLGSSWRAGTKMQMDRCTIFRWEEACFSSLGRSEVSRS